MKSLICCLALALCISGCTYNILTDRSAKRFSSNHREMIMAQIDQLKILDSVAVAQGLRIRPIIINNKGVGIYGYYKASTHFGRVKFFSYKPNTVTLISRVNEDSLQAEVQRFLEANNFSARRIKVAAERVKSVYDILSTDSF